MKRKFFLLMTSSWILLFSCKTPPSTKPADWNEAQLNSWFKTGDWKSGWNVSPDESIDKKEFAIQYHRNRQRWDKAFSFLRNSDLLNMDTGKYPIEGDSLFVNLSEYMTRNEEDTQAEIHRKYADIQYLVRGEEQIGIMTGGKTVEISPYDSIRDVMFLSVEQNNFRHADSSLVFIIFPGAPHRPSVKTGESQPVRKAVVKVLIE